MKKSNVFYLITGALTATMLVLIGMKYPAPLYSPGELSQKHENLRCRECHAPFKRVSSESCSKIDCHAVGMIGKKPATADLHKRIVGQDCLACHTDHKGGNGKITIAFDHEAFLKKSRCVDCHRRDGEKAHKDRYGENCTDCHGTKDWEKISFSHEKVSTTPCADCHKAPSDDLHIRAGKQCASCHTVKAWKPATYNHDDYFALDRPHNVACDKCHDRQTFKQYNCMNCHEHATRGIINEHREEGIRDFGDCLRCHRVNMKGRNYGTDRTGEGMKDDND